MRSGPRVTRSKLQAPATQSTSRIPRKSQKQLRVQHVRSRSRSASVRIPRSRRGQVKLLEIQSSPRGESSDSITLTTSFIEVCKSASASIVVDVLNVWHEEATGVRLRRNWSQVQNSEARNDDGGRVQGVGAYSIVDPTLSERRPNPGRPAATRRRGACNWSLPG
jgi:hypothetical protein